MIHASQKAIEELNQNRNREDRKIANQSSEKIVRLSDGTFGKLSGGSAETDFDQATGPYRSIQCFYAERIAKGNYPIDPEVQRVFDKLEMTESPKHVKTKWSHSGQKVFWKTFLDWRATVIEHDEISEPDFDAKKVVLQRRTDLPITLHGDGEKPIRVGKMIGDLIEGVRSHDWFTFDGIEVLDIRTSADGGLIFYDHVVQRGLD